jgi:hypothetical protein
MSMQEADIELRPRGRGLGLDRSICFGVGVRIRYLQSLGIRNVREIVEALNGSRLSPCEARWSYGTVHRHLVRGAELGVLLPPLSAGDAASQRNAKRPSWDVLVHRSYPALKRRYRSI